MKWSRLAKFLFSNRPDYWETEQNWANLSSIGKPNTIRKQIRPLPLEFQMCPVFQPRLYFNILSPCAFHETLALTIIVTPADRMAISVTQCKFSSPNFHHQIF